VPDISGRMLSFHATEDRSEKDNNTLKNLSRRMVRGSRKSDAANRR